MEGTEAVNTSQTNGSPFEDAANQAGQVSADIGKSNHVISSNASEITSAGENEKSTPVQESPVARTPSQPLVNGSVPKPGDKKQSFEKPSVIQKSVDHVQSPITDCVDGVLEIEPRDHGAIEFCVTCPDAPVRRLRLTGDRYTFGSAKGCSIRLCDEMLRPMHAVLLCDDSRIIVRAYSVPVEVNATQTMEANLRVGDILRLGQYQFELLSVTPAAVHSSGEGCDEKPEEIAAVDGRVDSNMADSSIHENTDAQENQTPCCSETSSLNNDADDTSLEYQQWRDLLSREVDQWREQFKLLSAKMEQLTQQQSDFVALEEIQQHDFQEDECHSQEVILEQPSDRFEEQHTDSRISCHIADVAESTLLSELEASESLRLQVEELQQIVADARSESEMLREDCEQASSSVRQLEQLVSESDERDGEQRETWMIEANELRSSFEKLSTEMDQANFELNELRQANATVNQRLDEVKQERDQARSSLEASPSQQEVESLRKQLEVATERVGDLQLDHEQTLVRLEAAEQRQDGLKRSDASHLHHADAVWEEVGTEGLDVSAVEALEELGQQVAEGPTVDANEKKGGQAGLVCSLDLQDDSEDEAVQAGDDACSMTGVTLPETEREAGITSIALAESQADLDAAVSLTHSNHQTEGSSWTAHMTTESVGLFADIDAGEDESDDPAETSDWSGSSVCDATNKLDEADIEAGDVSRDDPGFLGMDQEMAPDSETAVVDQSEAPGGCCDNNVIPEESFSGNGEDDGVSRDSPFLDDPLISGLGKNDSMEAYMNRLIEQVRGNGEETYVPGGGSFDVSASPEYDLESTVANATRGRGELAAESCPDADGMRELANASARVVDGCNQRLRSHHLKIKAVVRLVGALGSILVGGVCYALFAGLPAYVAFAMTSLLAVAYALEARKLFQEASPPSATSEKESGEDKNITVDNE